MAGFDLSIEVVSVSLMETKVEIFGIEKEGVVIHVLIHWMTFEGKLKQCRVSKMKFQLLES